MTYHLLKTYEQALVTPGTYLEKGAIRKPGEARMTRSMWGAVVTSSGKDVHSTSTFAIYPWMIHRSNIILESHPEHFL